MATRAVDGNGLGLALSDALENTGEFRSRIRLLPEEKPLLPTLLRLLGEIPCSGKHVHDAHIVAAALVHKVPRIVTLNRDDFAPFSRKTKVVSPADARG